jgi:hypothetical protein
MARRSYYSSQMQWAPYVPVAERRRKAALEAAKMAKKGQRYSPVIIEGRTIARSFWGKGWCDHLESFSDYANRLPRGRTYARNGSVIDLQLTAGSVKARVSGSQIYTIDITVRPLPPARWKAVVASCSGKIDSLVGLLQGKLSDGVMKVVTDRAQGLFPGPGEIKMRCSCPDSAHLCKHLAAVLYGVGARLDTQPELLFTLRGVDPVELLSSGAALTPGTRKRPPPRLGGQDLGALFGIDIDDGSLLVPESSPAPSSPAAPRGRGRGGATTAATTAAALAALASSTRRNPPARRPPRPAAAAKLPPVKRASKAAAPPKAVAPSKAAAPARPASPAGPAARAKRAAPAKPAPAKRRPAITIEPAEPQASRTRGRRR